ncbi:MAG TPA: VWA domain-containing protein [Gemmataceae bacterium]|nr:VWA domain-containing protein [Gemmataceae bacterium]
MLFEFSKWDGSQQFRPLSADVVFDKLSEHLLEYGDYVLRQLEHLDEENADLLKMLIKEGYLEKDEEGKYAISPRGTRRIENKALDELFTITRKDSLGKHPSDFKGAGQVQHSDSKPYEYGDPVANLNLHETLKNAFHRQASSGQTDARLNLIEDDFVVYETEYQTSCATVVLLDMSGSMARYGKYYHAKKTALALQGLVRSRYSEDSLKVIGFYTYASPMTERELLHSAPKPVSIFDSRVFLRVHLDSPPDFVPQHFTNIQAGLKFARQHLKKQPAANKQIIVITDGEPTAHVEGRELVLIYPPSERTARHTLQEVQACASAGIQISTFALIEDYFYNDLVNFVDQMARAGHGLAVYCNAGELGGYVLDSFVRGRRSRRKLG